MKNSHGIVSALLGFFLLWGAPYSYGTDGFVKGTVEFVRVHEAAYNTNWTPPMFWFSLDGVASAGTCPTWSGRVLFVAQSKEAYMMVLSAQLTGKQVAVYWIDDASRPNGLCRAEYMTTGNPPPLF